MATPCPTTQQKFYLTTPIYYVNARPHIGHAYTTIAADVIARRHRLLGDDTFFLTGTDEHGQKVERSAAAAGISPQHFADQVSASFRTLWDRMGITYDDYIRTTDPRHKSAVQKLFQLLYDRDAIYLSTYTGQYSVGEEMFVEGPPGTIGPDGKPTETVTEENYFFRLSAYQRPAHRPHRERPARHPTRSPPQRSPKLPPRQRNRSSRCRQNRYRSEHPHYRHPERSLATSPRGESKDLSLNIADTSQPIRPRTRTATRLLRTGTPYVPGALKDLSISRTSFSWGIPVPGNEKHVIYVWLDALTNYMTAIGYGSDDPAEQAKFEKYWPADLHLVGKEIIRFHCVYWPAFLLAAGLPLPKAITAHGWLLFEESKMSKIPRQHSPHRNHPRRLRHPLSLQTRPDAFPDAVLSDASTWKHEQDLFAADVLRYFLLREIPFGQDGSFSFDALVQRYNS